MCEKVDRILKNYIPLVEFLGTILGNNSEVILHDVTDLDNSVVAIHNSLSGRKVGSPATDFVLDFIHKANQDDRNFLSNYKGKTEDNRIFNSSSFFIRDGKELIGILCVNTDKTVLLDLEKAFDRFVSSCGGGLVEPEEELPLENLYSNTEKLISEEVEKISKEKGISAAFLKGEDKIQVVENLYHKGFFLLKDAIPQVAKAINISEPSVYRYLKIIKEKQL